MKKTLTTLLAASVFSVSAFVYQASADESATTDSTATTDESTTSTTDSSESSN